MKNIITSCILVCVFTISIVCYFILKLQYEKNYNRIYREHSEDFGSHPFCIGSLSSYYDAYGRMPDFFADAIYEGMDIYNYLHFWDTNMKDWLSRGPEEYPIYSYYKVYERDTKEAVGFVILSAGIDGKTDVIFSTQDTLYTDDYLKKIGIENLYNPNHYYENHGNTQLSERPVPEFNLRDYFFGKKDLLLEYGNLKRDKAYNDSSYNERRKQELGNIK